MSSTRLAVFAVLVLLGASQASADGMPQVSCPSAVKAGDKLSPLQRVSVYDGPVNENVDLVPAQVGTGKARVDTWDLDGVSQGGSPIHLVCRYGGQARRVILVPATAKVCRFKVRSRVAECR